MTTRPRTVLADDHALVAEGLRRMLEDVVELVAVAGDGEELVALAERLQPELVITDITMPKLNGLDAVRRLCDCCPARVIVLTMHADTFLAAEALRAGADAYVLKHSAGDELRDAIAAVRRGERYVSSLLPAERVTAILEGGRDAGMPRLTPRQRQILQLVAQGQSMKQIASQLDISRRTAETHKYQMMEALGVHTTAELVQYAIRLGLLTVPGPRLQ